MAANPTTSSPAEAAPSDPVAWRDGHVRLLDQTRLPAEARHIAIDSVEQAAEAIAAMRVRGPAIPIEERAKSELLRAGEVDVAAPGARALHPGAAKANIVQAKAHRASR